MKNAIICDSTTMMIVGMLSEVETAEPPVPDDDTMDQYAMSEATMVHFEWQRKRHATYTMLSARLVALAREQLIEQ